MATTELFPYPVFRALDKNGDPMPGAKLYTYAAGTSTPLATYDDYDGLTANDNPVICDSAGFADVWLTESTSYKLVLKDANDVQLWEKDNITGNGSGGGFGTLDISDSTTPGTVTIGTQTLVIDGTASEIETVCDGARKITVGLPAAVSITTSLDIGGTGGTEILSVEDGNFELYNTSDSDSLVIERTGVTEWQIDSGGGLTITCTTTGDLDLLTSAGDITLTPTGGVITITGTTNIVGAATVSTSLDIGSSIAVTGVLDEDDMASDSAVKLATQQSIKKYVDDSITAEDLDFAGDTGTGAVDLDSQSLTIAGTAGEIETAAASQTLTIGLPAAVSITTSLDIGSSIAVTGVLDEDDMASDSAVKLCTQQSIKKYVDDSITAEDFWDRDVGNGYTYLKNSGDNVGIGISAPNTQFHLYSSTKTAELKVESDFVTGAAYLYLDRGADDRVAGINYQTTGVTDWVAGILYNGGSSNSDYGIGTSTNLSDAKLLITTAGNVGIGTSALTEAHVKISAAKSLSSPRGLEVSSALTSSGGTSSRQVYIGGSQITEDNTITYSGVYGLEIAEPAITKGASDTITQAATVHIQAAPSEGTKNYALLVDAGNVAIGGTNSSEMLSVVDGNFELYSTTDTDSLIISRTGATAWQVDAGGALVIKTTTTGDLTLQADYGDIILDPTGDEVKLNGAVTVDGSGVTSISMPDHTASALVIKEASDGYITIDTTNDAEKITFDNAIFQFDGTVNSATAFAVRVAGNNYINIDGTTNTEIVQLGNAAQDPAFQWISKGNFSLFTPVVAGETPVLEISGHATGGTKDTLQISVGTDVDQQASFAGCAAGYYFDNKLTVEIPDDTAVASQFKQGANNYLEIVTTTGSPNIIFGNTTTNPPFNFAGTGNLNLGGGDIDIATGGVIKIDTNQILTSQQSALTTQLTSITHTSPGTPDYAIQDLTNDSPYGFVTKDEGNTVLSVILNLQVRVAELESRLQTHGLIA